MDMQTAGEQLRDRMDALGISKREFADRADVDRNTLGRVLADDPKVRAATRGKVEKALSDLEEEIGDITTGKVQVVTVELPGGVKVTLEGAAPADIAETVRMLRNQSRP